MSGKPTQKELAALDEIVDFVVSHLTFQSEYDEEDKQLERNVEAVSSLINKISPSSPTQ